MKLTVHCVSASDLLAADRSGFSDPFVELKVIEDGKETSSVSTTVKKQTLSPEWNETFSLEFSCRPEDLRVSAIIYDKDLIGKDFLGGVIAGNLQSLVKGETHLIRARLLGVEKGVFEWSLKAEDFGQVPESDTKSATNVTFGSPKKPSFKVLSTEESFKDANTTYITVCIENQAFIFSYNSKANKNTVFRYDLKTFEKTVVSCKDSKYSYLLSSYSATFMPAHNMVVFFGSMEYSDSVGWAIAFHFTNKQRTEGEFLPHRLKNGERHLKRSMHSAVALDKDHILFWGGQYTVKPGANLNCEGMPSVLRVREGLKAEWEMLLPEDMPFYGPPTPELDPERNAFVFVLLKTYLNKDNFVGPTPAYYNAGASIIGSGGPERPVGHMFFLRNNGLELWYLEGATRTWSPLTITQKDEILSFGRYWGFVYGRTFFVIVPEDKHSDLYAVDLDKQEMCKIKKVKVRQYGFHISFSQEAGRGIIASDDGVFLFEV